MYLCLFELHFKRNRPHKYNTMHQIQDELFMQRCLQLAENTLGNTYPNPMVGAVVVYDGKIIGEGYHIKAGGPHAEVMAIRSVNNKALLRLSTLYVNLEPCSHEGRTPACSKLIIDSKIPRVVVGCKDSFELVAGTGIQNLKAAAINVTVGVLEKQSRELNKRFFTFHEKKRPYIILKWAGTIDGFIDFERSPGTPVQPNWITDDFARMLVHKWRSEEQAVMAATNTIEKDDPKLNVRDWTGHQPIRVILDRTLRLKKTLSVFNGIQKTIVFTEKQQSNTENTDYFTISFGTSFYDEFCRVLYDKNIQSILVEGGAKFLQNLIDHDYWDEAREFIGKIRFMKGIRVPTIPIQPIINTKVSGSVLHIFRNG
jgi:diaminohydroxyphosphoribosylaminopyrimidine deaminase/5-amino-6-(5-phosphoribosylamino)uracil reductase